MRRVACALTVFSFCNGGKKINLHYKQDGEQLYGGAKNTLQ